MFKNKRILLSFCAVVGMTLPIVGCSTNTDNSPEITSTPTPSSTPTYSELSKEEIADIENIDISREEFADPAFYTGAKEPEVCAHTIPRAPSEEESNVFDPESYAYYKKLMPLIHDEDTKATFEDIFTRYEAGEELTYDDGRALGRFSADLTRECYTILYRKTKG